MQSVLDVLSKVKLSPGRHESRNQGLCIMECVAYVAGESHTDLPACACEVASGLAIYINDNHLPRLGARLARRVLALAGSKVDEEHTRRRAYFVVDQVMRKVLPDSLPPKEGEIIAALRAVPVVDSPEKIEILLKTVDALDRPRASKLGDFLSERIRKACGALQTSSYSSATYYMTRVLDQAPALPPADLMALLDGVLAIGAPAPAEPTPIVKVRVAELAARTQAEEIF